MLNRYTTQARKLTHLQQFSARAFANRDQPQRVLISGAAGQIAYSIVYRIAS